MSVGGGIARRLIHAWRRLRSVFSEELVGSPEKTCPYQNCKEVSGKAMKRLSMAKEAMDYAKQKLRHGAGNQYTHLLQTKFNSNESLRTARNKRMFNIPKNVISYTEQYPPYK